MCNFLYFIHVYKFAAIIPTKNPSILPIADICPLYNLFDSGISSPETIYSIAPAANPKQIEIIVSDIEPIIAPN